MSKVTTIKDIMGQCQSVIKWRLTDVCNYNCDYCIRKIFVLNPDNSRGEDPNSLRLKEDREKLNNSMLEVARIINELPGLVKLDLIGGEVSLFNLKEIFNKIFEVCGSKLHRINITTNMFRPAEYYNELIKICEDHNSELGITCSYHDRFVSFEKFFDTFLQIKSKNQKGIRAEMVSRRDNQPNVSRFILFCEQNNITYFVEKDLREDAAIKKILLYGASEFKKPRYTVEYDDGLVKKCLTRNEFITSGEDGNTIAVDTVGKYCTRDYDYVYIEQDLAVGNSPIAPTCKNKTKLCDYHPLKEPKKCWREMCTLCGHMSLSEDMTKLLKEM